MTLEESLYLCLIISCIGLWLFGGIIIFHWFLRRSVDRWAMKIYSFLVEDDDSSPEKRRTWLTGKAGELWARVVNRRVG